MAPSADRRRRSLFGRLLRWSLIAAAILGAGSVVVVAALRFVPPPLTPLMLIRGVGAGAWPPHYRWTRLERISPHLWQAALAGEDARFCAHDGFDWIEIGKAYRAWRGGDRLRGASTITNQTAKNLFLWPGRSLLRKGLEAWYSLWIEWLWPKRRILEIYLNIAEWGDGVYGAEAAAQTYFRRPASVLTPHQAATLAALLPNPRERGDALASDGVRDRAALILSRMAALDADHKALCRLRP